MNLSLGENMHLSSLFRHRFVKNVAILQIGGFAGNVIQAVIGIILARLLQPELFGTYSLAFGLAGITSLVMGAGIQEAISSLLGRAHARRDSEEVSELLGFMLKITIWAALIVAVGLIFFPALADKLYGNSLIGIYAAIISLAVIISSTFFAITYSSLQVSGRIKSLTGLIVSDQIFRYGSSLAFVVAGFGVFGAVSGHLAGALIILLISSAVFHKLRTQDSIFPDIRSLIHHSRGVSLKKYFGFTFWVALDRNMGNVFMALPVILAGIYVTASEVSFFKLAFGYMNLALSFLGPISILLNVEFPKTQIEDGDRLYRNFKRVSFYSLLLSMLLAAGAIITAPVMFKILYGESFAPSIRYVFGFAAYGALYGIGVGLGPMWRAIDKVKISIAINVAILAAGIPFGLWLIKNYSLWGAVIMVTAWFTVSHFVSFFYLAKKLKNT